ncbi:MAG TPA: hypothetical protein VEN82_02670 [Actinomycetota bacterium]|nr:hypothetical protein [Actinomycetota bacterium]
MAAEPLTVLVVERSDEARDRLACWIEEAGYTVTACPGPTSPDYRCVGGRTGGCPLVQGADAIVLDLWLESDAALEGTSAIDLLGYYLGSGSPVIALTHSEGFVDMFCDEDLVTLPSPPDRREVVETIRSLLRGRGERDQDGAARGRPILRIPEVRVERPPGPRPVGTWKA